VAVTRGDTLRGLAQMTSGWQMIADELGPDHPRTRRNAARIADIVEQQHGLVPARPWRARAGRDS
jgi:hypothetical protein